MKVIVGLGNPGAQFYQTRHNAGLMATRWLSKEWGMDNLWVEKKRLMSFVAVDPEKDLVLSQPTTFMNNSGLAVRRLMDFYKVQPSDITVIHDDADLKLGSIRQSDSTISGAGHHGVLSTLQHIGPGFHRIRIGIGRPDLPQRDISGYVLERFSEEEATTVLDALRHNLRKMV